MMTHKKILITGSRGMLAQDLISVLSSSYSIIPKTEHELDICDAHAVYDTITTVKPDVVINCAAYTLVDNCEVEKDKAFAVNADGVKHIARACGDSDSLLVHFSTDYVFDGTKREPYTEADLLNPLSVYGQSKRAGEEYIQNCLERYVIIRSLWLYGRGGNNFVATIMRLVQENKELKVVHDQTGAPTWTRHLAMAVAKLLATDPRGIYHVANQGSCSWYEYAKKIIELTGAGVPVIPITSREINRPAPRPAYSVLDCSKFERATEMRLPSWDAALTEYITTEHGRHT